MQVSTQLRHALRSGRSGRSGVSAHLVSSWISDEGGEFVFRGTKTLLSHPKDSLLLGCV